MIRFMNHLIALVAVVFVAACAMYDIDSPPPGPTDIWQKSGYTKSQTYSVLVKCGQGQMNSDEDLEKEICA